MSIITLLTDFGLEDPFVGIMKGVILSVNPSARVIDVSHHINPQDLIQTAFVLESVCRYFPEKTVHVIVVDPGVGSDRAVVAVQIFGQTFIAPDNGVLTLVMNRGEVVRAVRLENSNYFLSKVSRTFHGRDIFAPVAAHISRGVGLDRLGPPIDHQDLVRLEIPRPFISEEHELVGSIVFFDRFGNCITNIDEHWLEKFCQAGNAEKIQCTIKNKTIGGLSENYESVAEFSPLAIVGSFGLLEIALNRGSARRYFEVNKGDTVRVIFGDAPAAD